jgi:hypothetical protein
VRGPLPTAAPTPESIGVLELWDSGTRKLEGFLALFECGEYNSNTGIPLITRKPNGSPFTALVIVLVP